MEPFRTLLPQSLLRLGVGTVLVVACYFFVDRPVAFFVYERGVNELPFLKEFTYLPMALNALAPVVVVAAVVRLAFGPLSHPERVAFAGAVSLMAAVALEYYLKYLAGRYWPETWVQDNPSLIGTGAYGFHPLHFGEAFGSFPSGHTGRVVAVFSVIGIAYPRWRVACLAVCGLVVVGLVGMNYHFVGDTVGGALLGTLTGTYTAAFFGLLPAPKAGHSPTRA